MLVSFFKFQLLKTTLSTTNKWVYTFCITHLLTGYIVQQDVFLALKEIPFLSDLADEPLSELAAHAKSHTFPKNAFIMTEGDETSSMYILLSGKIRVFSSDDQGKEVTLLVQTPVSYFGELALLSNEPRSASVIALEKTHCAIIAQTDFKTWLSHHSDVAFSLIQDLAGTVRRLTDKVKQLALSNVYERTIQTLQEMASKEGDILIINKRPTQQELANMVGASREMVNKIMKELTKGGYIVIEGKALKIQRKLPTSW